MMQLSKHQRVSKLPKHRSFCLQILVCDYDEMRFNPCFGVAVGIVFAVFARFLCTSLLVVDLFQNNKQTCLTHFVTVYLP